MPEYLELKSKVTDIYDYKKVDISSFIPDFTVDSAMLEKDIQRVRSLYGKKIDSDEVQNGDQVVLSCHSENKRFCKDKLTVPVGKGLFSKELEAKIVGMKTGGEETITVDGTPVTVSIQKVTRTVLPELTDENVKAWGMENVDSVATLKKHCINLQIDRFLGDDESADSASAYVWQKVGENSTFTLDQQEYDNAIAEADEKYKDMMASPSTDDEDVEEDLLEDGSGVFGEDAEGNAIDTTTFLHDMYVNCLRIAAIGNAISKEAGNLLTMDDYNLYIQRLMESDNSLTIDTAKEKRPVEQFMKDRYTDVLAETLDLYVVKSFKEIMNP